MGILLSLFFTLVRSFSIHLFHKMLDHQTTTNQTKINDLKNRPCYKYEMMRPRKEIINLANLKITFILPFI